jgi:hypothetical protein
MTKHLKYDDSFQVIKRATHINIQILDAIIKNLTEFSNGIVKLQKDLSKTFKTLPKLERKVPIKKHYFKRPKINVDELNPEPELANIVSTLLQYMISPPKLMEFIEAVRTQLIDKLVALKAQYEETVTSIELANEKSSFIVKSAQNAFGLIYNEYNSICEQIEEIHSALQTQESEVIRDQYKTLKEQFNVKQKQLFNILKTLNDENNRYNLSMETSLTKWEESDLNKEHSLQQLFNDFSHTILDLSVNTESISQDIKEALKRYDFASDHMQYNAQIFKVPQSQRKLVSFSIPPLPFNILEYVSPKDIFEDELQQYTDIATRDYDGDIHISANEELTVHSRSDDLKTAVVSRPSTGEICEVPYSILYHNSQKERVLMKLVRSFNNGDVILNVGDIVCAEGISQVRTMCTTITGQKVELPVSMLTTV